VKRFTMFDISKLQLVGILERANHKHITERLISVTIIIGIFFSAVKINPADIIATRRRRKNTCMKIETDIGSEHLVSFAKTLLMDIFR
jgi:hypothetical protein